MSRIDEFDDHTYASNEFWKYMRSVEKGLSGDVVLACNPSTCGSSAEAVAAAITADEKFVRTVEVTLKDSAGNLHEWFNGSFSVAVTKSSTSGLAALDEGVSTVKLVNGVGKVNINYTGTWAAEDTCTLTVTGKTFGGVATNNQTSVDTLVA